MGNGLVLKFKGNKSFVAFSNLGDTEALAKTWKVCTKVAAHLEQGQRLENLSWRLWHLQSLMVESDNAKSKREFRRLSKHMGEKLDKEKGRSIEELSAPQFTSNESNERVRRLAEEKERNREHQHANSNGHMLNRMQFTFEIDPPPNGSANHSGSSNAKGSGKRHFTKKKDKLLSAQEDTATNSPSSSSSPFSAAATVVHTSAQNQNSGQRQRQRHPLFDSGSNANANSNAPPNILISHGNSHSPSDSTDADQEMTDADQDVDVPMDMDISPSTPYRPLVGGDSVGLQEHSSSGRQVQGDDGGVIYGPKTPTNATMHTDPDPGPGPSSAISLGNGNVTPSAATNTRLRFPSLFPSSTGAFAPTALLYTTPVLEEDEYGTMTPDYSSFNHNFGNASSENASAGASNGYPTAHVPNTDGSADADVSGNASSVQATSTTVNNINSNNNANATSANNNSFNFSYPAPSLSYGEAPASTTSGMRRNIAWGVRRPTIEVQLEEFLGPSTSEGEDGDDGDWEDDGDDGEWGVKTATVGSKRGRKRGTAAAAGRKGGMKGGRVIKEEKGRTKFAVATSSSLSSSSPSIGDAQQQQQKNAHATSVRDSTLTNSGINAPTTPTLANTPIATNSASASASASTHQHAHAPAAVHGLMSNPTPDIIDRAKTPRQNPRPLTNVTTPTSVKAQGQASTPAGGGTGLTKSGQKSECVNCGATHTPLWRRGLNDELNCNACGLYCKLHKRPRPKTMRGGANTVTSPTSIDLSTAKSLSVTSTPTPATTLPNGAGTPSKSGSSTSTAGAGGTTNTGVATTSASTGSEPGTKQRKSTTKRHPHTSRGNASVAARCVNCHTMATPLWRKDDEGKTVCNACGLYFKLHNSNRPISMKSDVIRKRARHEQIQHQQIPQAAPQPTPTVTRGRSSTGTPSATSPSVSRHSSPERDARDSHSVERYPPLPNSPSSSNGHSSGGGQGQAPARRPEKPVPAGPDPYDPSQAAFNFPADHGQFEFPNATSPSVGHMELGGHGSWHDNQHHQARRLAASGNPNGYGGGYNEFGDYSTSSNFPGPFHPDYLRSLGVNIGGWDYGGRFGVAVNENHANEVDQKPVINRATGVISVDTTTNMDRSSKRRRLSTDSYASSIASATDPPSSTSSLFPLGDNSTASFSSHRSSFNTHRRNQSSLSTQSSDISHLSQSTSDFSMEFFKHIHPTVMSGDNSESEMMSLLNLNHEHSNGQASGSNEMYHPPMMLPFAENYPDDVEVPFGPPNGPNSGAAVEENSSGAEDYIDITMSGLFNSQY